MIPLAYRKRDYCKKFIMVNRFKRISGRWETVNDSRSTFVSGWKRANCHLYRRENIDLNIKTIPAARYTRGLQYLDSLLRFFILSRSVETGVCPMDSRGCPMNLEISLYALLSHPYSRTPFVFCLVHKKRPRVDLFSTKL